MRVPRFQVKVPSEGSEGSEVEVRCQVSKKFQVKVPGEGFKGSEVPSTGSESSVSVLLMHSPAHRVSPSAFNSPKVRANPVCLRRSW